MASAPERIVSVRVRTVLTVLAITFVFAAALLLLYLAWHIITWILIALFLALALNPAVEFFQRHGLKRGWASALVFFIALLTLAALASLLAPPLVAQIQKFAEAVPDLIDDLIAGRGRLGFLQEDYELVDRVRTAIEEDGLGDVLGITQPALAVAQGVVTAIVGAVSIAFLTFFMLLEGPRAVERALDALPERARPRWARVGEDIYRTVGGYVTGNLLISFIAGIAAAAVLFGVGSDYAVALALVVAVLDLVPLAGATLAAVLVSTVIFIELGWVRGVIVAVFFLFYQQLENHILQPVIYGRTVQLSPLTVLIAILIGAQLAGILGALAAIPVAGIVQAVARELIRYRRESMLEAPVGALVEPSEPVG